MLQRIFIQNYAIIEEITIDFSAGLNIITGETGAGKSIIVGALSLILGERADTSVLLNKEKKSVIEGQFKAGDNKLITDLLNELELDTGEDLLIRREINSTGKSRAFINDTPVNLSQLEKLAGLLVDLHRQFDSLDLGQAGFQRQVLDALAGQQDKVDEYSELFKEWEQLNQEIRELKTKQGQFEKETDYNRFQLNELKEAAFRENEIEEAETAIKLLNHAEEIKAVLARIYYELKDSETPIVQQLKSLLNQLSNYSEIHKDLPLVNERLRSAQVELNDIAEEINRIEEHIHSDISKLTELNERLSLGYKLQKKHGVHSTNELLGVQQSLEQKLKDVLDLDEIISVKEKQADQLMNRLRESAAVISENRQKQVKPFQSAVNELLSRVGMPNARIKVELATMEPGAFGTDRIEFLFNANTTGKNKSEVFQPVRKVASGGELSRLMLCIKSLVATSVNLPTMIFDEIDTGISGEAARQVGIIMKELSSGRQVICITHQPQIAGKANAHYYVFKEIEMDKIKTNIRLLSTEERITTIAQMLSGEKPTAAALENAREIIMN